MALAFGFLFFQNIILIFHSFYTHVRNTRDDENLRKEPKFIVFLSQLLLLFKFCHFCKTDCHLVEMTVDGGALIIESNCGNPTCPNKRSVWRSQPLMPGSKINTGDFLQSFSILVSEGSPAKVGLNGISLETFYRHQRVCIVIYSISYPSHIIELV